MSFDLLVGYNARGWYFSVEDCSRANDDGARIYWPTDTKHKAIRFEWNYLGWTFLGRIKSHIRIVVIANVLYSLVTGNVELQAISNFFVFEWHSVVLMINNFSICTFLLRSTRYRYMQPYSFQDIHSLYRGKHGKRKASSYWQRWLSRLHRSHTPMKQFLGARLCIGRALFIFHLL